MIKWKIDVLAALKDAGYTSTRIRRERIMGEMMLQKVRQGQLPSWNVLGVICGLLGCQPGELLEFVPDEDEKNEPG